MPGEISRCHSGPTDACPYVPEWCYDPPGPKICKCGCHEGYHSDAGVCLRERKCGCTGFSEKVDEPADGNTPNPSHHDGAASAPSVDGVVQITKSGKTK